MLYNYILLLYPSDHLKYQKDEGFFLKDQTTFLPLSNILMEGIGILKKKNLCKKIKYTLRTTIFCQLTTFRKNCHVLYCQIAQIGLLIFFFCILLSLLLFSFSPERGRRFLVEDLAGEYFRQFFGRQRPPAVFRKQILQKMVFAKNLFCPAIHQKDE
jgi:hypothetical protein